MICGVVVTCISGCDMCTACRVVSRTLHGTRYTHHSLKYLSSQYRKSYNDVILLNNSTKNCSFSKAQHKIPEDGPSGPKCVEANTEIF